MDFGKQLWSVYLDEHAPRSVDGRSRNLTGLDFVAALWWFSRPLTPKVALMKEIGGFSEYEEAADGALANLALSGDRAGLDAASLGAWKVLAGRWGWAVSGILLETGRGIKLSIPVPHQAPKELTETAAFLYALGTLGREPPPLWRGSVQSSELSRLLASGPAWRQ